MEKLPLITNFPYPYYQYGSADSTDIDVIISIPKSIMPSTQEERKQFVFHLKKEFNLNWNATLAVFEEGIMIDTIYTKSWIDSLNNAIFRTYNLHKQHFENPVKQKVERNTTLAIYKAVRTVLSMLTRTKHRSEIKSALKSIHPFHLKLDILESLDFSTFSDFNQANTNNEDIWKILAFYIGQNMALITEKIEIYSKSELVELYPSLTPFIYRKSVAEIDLTELNSLKNKWLKEINNYGTYTMSGHFLHCKHEIIDMKNEKF